MVKIYFLKFKPRMQIITKKLNLINSQGVGFCNNKFTKREKSCWLFLNIFKRITK